MELVKISETASTITLGWQPPANVDLYVFYKDGIRVSTGAPLLKNGTPRKSVKFSKATWYEVVALTRTEMP